MKYDEERNEFVIADRRFPVYKWVSEDLGFAMHVRRVLLMFENTWGLSVIWGSFAYGSNYPFHFSKADFIEEPSQVEVGIFSPEARKLPGTVFELDGEPHVVPDAETPLWCDPFGWVTEEPLLLLIKLVSGLPSSGLEPPSEHFDVGDAIIYLHKVVH